MNPQIEQMIIDALEGKLTPESQQELNILMEKDSTVLEVYQQYQILYQSMEAVPMEIPSKHLKNNFNHWLAEEQALHLKERPPLQKRWNLQWTAAAAAVLLIISAAFGILLKHNNEQQKQIIALAEQMNNTKKVLALSMLDQPSASQRIKAMNDLSGTQELVDPQIIEALVHTLQTDENVNVRLTATEALTQFAGNPGVTEGLISALKTESDPRVQIEIIESLVSIGAGQAVPQLEDLLQQDTIVPIVKERAAKGIEILM